jgi:hypothetical protein
MSNSIPNDKILQKSWRAKKISSLTKTIEKIMQIYDIKYISYENIINVKFKDT